MADMTSSIDTVALEKAEKIKGLVLERELALQRIKSLEVEIQNLKKRKDELESQLNSFLSFPKTASKPEEKSDQPRPIPKKGIILWMAEVMSEEQPMTKDEILDALKKNGHDVGVNSVRAYLTNMDCFENIQISGPNYAKYNKKGWLCHKNRLG